MKKEATSFLKAIIAFLILSSSALVAQSGQVENNATINTQLVITIAAQDIDNLQAQYTLDISALNFQSEEILNNFCAIFSLDFHTLKGNYETKKITVLIDKEWLLNNSFSMSDVNNDFQSLSSRMQYIFNNQ